MFNERLSWLSLSSVHLKLECECGRFVMWEPSKLKAMPGRLWVRDLAKRGKSECCGKRPTLSPWVMRQASMFDRQERLVPYVRTRFLKELGDDEP